MGSIYNNTNSIYNTGTHSANSIVLSSALHIGGETQRTLESALNALNSGGGGSALSAMSDVEISNLEDGHVIVYDSIAGKWVNKKPLKIVTWADGTDEEIAAMLEAHYNDEINIYDYWTVGDERTVSLSAMEATGVGEAHVAQDVTMVLMNEGGKTLTTSINEHTECVFIVGQKDLLTNGTNPETGYIYNTNSTYGWYNCKRRTWCNSIYKNALPSTLVGIFKEHKNITGQQYSTATDTSNDFFALPSTKEILGTASYANSTAEGNNTQFKYYETSANRRKYYDKSNSTLWWTRSHANGSSYKYYFCYINANGSCDRSSSSNSMGIAPFGVI